MSLKCFQNVTRGAAGHAPFRMQAVSSVERKVSTLQAETQLNAAVIKRHIMIQNTSRIISETVWSSNAFSLAGSPEGEYRFISGFFTQTLSSVSSECWQCLLM